MDTAAIPETENEVEMKEAEKQYLQFLDDAVS